METRLITAFVLAIAALWAIPSAFSSDPVTSAIALLPSLIVGLACLQRPTLRNPMVWVCVSVFMGISLRTLYYSVSQSSEAERILSNLTIPDLRAGITVASVCCIAIAIGFSAPSKRF